MIETINICGQCNKELQPCSWFCSECDANQESWGEAELNDHSDADNGL